MVTPMASSCVLVNQQREQLIQYLKKGGRMVIAPCSAQPKQRSVKTCTVIEQGRVIVKPLNVSSGQIESVQDN